MLRGKENKKWFGMIVAIVWCLAVVGVARAGWPEQDKLLAADGAVGDEFGKSVSISGNLAIVGAPHNDKGKGSAYIFTPNDVDPNNWDQIDKLTASDRAAGYYFGWSVSISGDYAIVGAYGDDANGWGTGSAYIFTPNDVDPNNWDQTAKLTASDGAAEDVFGQSVSISGDCAIVGAVYDDDKGDNSGSAYIFEKPVGGWVDMTETAKLLASDGTAYDCFGLSVSISGDYAIVGAQGDDDYGSASGSAYIFKKPISGWVDMTETAKLLASDGASGDLFGTSVSISGDYAIVGALYDDDKGSDSGSAYIFTPNDVDPNNWDQMPKLTASDGAAEDVFGRSVSISGNLAIVGAYGDDDKGSISGSAYIFAPNDLDPNNWDQRAKLTASDGAAEDVFGQSVSISGNLAIVGARLDDDKGNGSGSAYVFERCPTADLNGDCWVDFLDYALFADQWQASGCSGPNWCSGADLDQSSDVNWPDLKIFTDHWLE